MLPTHDPKAAVKELERTAKLGLRGAMFEFTGAAPEASDRAWDPLWAIAEESGTAISFHIMGEPSDPAAAPWVGPANASIACMMLNRLLAHLVFSGVAERYPRLKLVLAESSLGWLPFVIERMEFEQENYKHRPNMPREKAGDVFRRNFHCTFQDETLGVKLIPYLGEDNVMWASDYPHADGSYPHSVETVDRIFKDASESVKRKATRDNMKRLYQIK